MQTRPTLFIGALALATTACTSTFEPTVQSLSQAQERRCNADFNAENGKPGCWIEIYDEEGFTGRCLTIHGPLELSDLDLEQLRDWEDEIESIRVGPNARVELYDDDGFTDGRLSLTERTMARNLEDLGLDDDVESLKIFQAD